MWLVFALVVLFCIDSIAGINLTWLYLKGNNPKFWQFFTATYFHTGWAHLSNNLFSLYVFGKVVE